MITDTIGKKIMTIHPGGGKSSIGILGSNSAKKQIDLSV